MISWKKNLIFIWLSQICTVGGFSCVMPFIPLFIRHQFHVTGEAELGVQVSMFNFFGYLSFCAAAPLWGVLADRFGRKMMLLRACFISALLFPLMYVAPNVYWLIGVRFVMSAFSGTTTAAQALIVTTTPEKHMGTALGTLSTALWSGSLIGFMVGSAVVHWFGFFCGFLSGGLMLAVGGLLVLFFVREDFRRIPAAVPAEKKEKRMSPGSWSAAVWIVMFLFMLMGLARRFDEPFVPIMIGRLTEESFVVGATGIISAATAVGGMLSGVVLGRLCDRIGPLKVAFPVILTAAAAAVVQAFSMNLVTFGTARFIAFFAAGGLEPVFQTMLTACTPPEKRGTLFGVASSLRMAGVLLAALLSGGVIWFGGVRAIFAAGAALFLLLLPMTLFAARTKSKN